MREHGEIVSGSPKRIARSILPGKTGLPTRRAWRSQRHEGETHRWFVTVQKAPMRFAAIGRVIQQRQSRIHNDRSFGALSFQPLLESCQLSGRAFYFDYQSRGGIQYPAAERHFGCEAIHKRAETHALHGPVQGNPQPLRGGFGGDWHHNNFRPARAWMEPGLLHHSFVFPTSAQGGKLFDPGQQGG